MSRMLNLVDELLSRARELHQLGRRDDAHDLLIRLIDFENLPDYAAEEVAIRLAEDHLRRRQSKLARRYLKFALGIQPADARTHYLMARALDAGASPNTRRALEHYRIALDLEPDHPAFLCRYGMLLARLGRSREALAGLRRAVKIAPDDVRILKNAVEGMRLANAADEARRLLLASRFRNPRDGQLLALWKDFQFQQLRKEQQTARPTSKPIVATPVVLAFVRPKGDPKNTRSGGKRIRTDAASGTPPPRGILRVRRPDQRHAQ
jgi:tetratricopeptide (TPR) repeat protein